MRHENRQAAIRRKRQAAKRRHIRFRTAFVMVLIGFGAVFLYNHIVHPYSIAIDAGHGGADVGAVGIINEVELTETTAEELVNLLEKDGRFRILETREKGETMDINHRCIKLRKWQPDIMLSIHANADDRGSGHGFECYPSVPGSQNHKKSMVFAHALAKQMQNQGHSLRGIDGIRFGYYVPSENGLQKWMAESTDTTVYDYDTFGVLKKLDGAAVLVEQCFVTNAADVNNFGTLEGCKKAADAYYAAILEYFGLNAPEAYAHHSIGRLLYAFAYKCPPTKKADRTLSASDCPAQVQDNRLIKFLMPHCLADRNGGLSFYNTVCVAMRRVSP